MPAFIADRYGNVKSAGSVVVKAGDFADSFLFGQSAHMFVIDIDSGIDLAGVNLFPALVKEIFPSAILDDQVAVHKGQVRQEFVSDARQLGHHGNGHARQQKQA